MGSATSIPAAAPSVVSGAVAATTVIKGHAHHDQPAIGRMDRPVALAYLSILLVSLFASFGLVPVYLHMMVATVSTIYIGSRYALKCWKLEGGTEETKHLHTGGAEQMQTKDAMMFPLIGSCVLFSLYCVYKLLPPQWINAVIKLYFFIFGCLVLAQKLAQILSTTLPVPTVHRLLAAEYAVPNPMWVLQRIESALMPLLKRVPFLGYNEPAAADAPAPEAPATFWTSVSLLDLVALALGVSVSIVYVSTGSWLASNMFGMAFSIQGIEMLSLGSYLNGCILLCGLFVYDVFWVFGTDVMVTVAKSFDAPIKLLFPQFGFGFEGALRPSMLGLGDIVIPGIFIALLLRYDIWRNIQRVRAAAAAKAVSSSSSSGAPAPLSLAAAHDLECLYCHMTAHASSLRLDYFYANLVAYFLGLSTTVWVMYSFGAAQPALLYLVPACLGCSLLQALVRGDLATLRRYTENEDDKAAAEAADKKKNDDATGVAVAAENSEAAATDAAAAAPQSPSEGEPRTPSTRARKVSASGSGSSKKKKAGGSSSKKKKSVRAE